MKSEDGQLAGLGFDAAKRSRGNGFILPVAPDQVQVAACGAAAGQISQMTDDHWPRSALIRLTVAEVQAMPAADRAGADGLLAVVGQMAVGPTRRRD